MSLETKGFEFEEFLLDTKQKVLLRAGKPVSITPKTYNLLLALVERHGRLVEKDELMKTVWADSFVEDGNLAFTMRLLRKALGDEKQNPRFIETVPRRGYRFIAEVKETSEKNGLNDGEPQTAAQAVEKISTDAPKFNKVMFPAVAILIAGVILIGFWFVKSKNSAAMPVLDAPFSSEKLSTNGKVALAIISPDGKKVVYVNGFGKDKESIWLRQLEDGSNTEIIPPADVFYGGLAFSPDGNFLYFARYPSNTDRQYDIYRISIHGGVPTKIIAETQGWISLSPEGDKISFVRCYYRDDEYCSLWIADTADGKNEKKLVVRAEPIRIGDNKISPDGKTVAFAAGQSQNAANEFGLFEVDIESGAERELTREKFFNISRIQWLPNRSDLLITSTRVPIKNYFIMRVSAATGEVEQLTKDAETYSGLSLDKSASLIVSTQIKRDFQLRLYQMDNPSVNRVLADASSANFMSNGRIIFSSVMSGNGEIWSVEPDGSGQRQLTSNPADDSRPIISPVGDSIFFVSNRTGEAHVWRMGIDGSNPVQVTQKEGGFPLLVTSDGQWVYYHHGISRTLWRVSTASGEEQLVFDKEKNYFSVSPDAKQVATYEFQGKEEERILTVYSLDDGQVVKTFRLGDRTARLEEIVWLPDGKTIFYTQADKKYENNVLWRQSYDGGDPQRIADLGDEETGYLAVSPDAKRFTVVQGSWRHDAVLLKGLR